MTGRDLETKFRRLVELREQRDIAKSTAEATEREYREYESELWDELEDSPMKGTIKIDLGEPYGVVSFQYKETYYGRVLDKDAALDYLDNNALTDEFTSPKLEMRRVNELVRECIEEQRPLPKGFDFYPKRFISISKRQG